MFVPTHCDSSFCISSATTLAKVAKKNKQKKPQPNNNPATKSSKTIIPASYLLKSWILKDPTHLKSVNSSIRKETMVKGKKHLNQYFTRTQISPGQRLRIPFFSFTITITITINLRHTEYSPSTEHVPCAEQMD